MSDEGNRESADLTDYQVLDSSDTLDGAPGDDPLDRGVATPDRWSAAIRLSRSEEGESLDEQLAEEEPEATGAEDEQPDGIEGDENATEEDIGRLQRAEGSDPRAGRLAGTDDETTGDDEAYLTASDDLTARDEGIDGGGATAEEAAVHVVDDDTE